jgi:hypothetical protein
LFMHLLGIAVLFFFGTSNNSLSFCFFFFFLNFFRALEFCCRCMCFLFFFFVFLRRIRTIFIILHDSFQLPQRKWALDKLMKVRP